MLFRRLIPSPECCSKTVVLLAVAGFAPFSLAKPPAPATAPAQEAAVAESVSGTIEAFNVSPKGEFESLMLKAPDGPVQVLLSSGTGTTVMELVGPRDRITVTCVRDKVAASHPVYRMLTLTTESGRQFSAGPQAPKAKQPKTDAVNQSRMVNQVDVTVRQLNHGRHGEVNGAQVQQGNYVLIGPELAKRLNLSIGQRLTVDGVARPMWRGRTVIEATKVNGMDVPKKPMPAGGPKDQKPPKAPKASLTPEAVPADVMKTLRSRAGQSEFSKLEWETKGDRDVYTGKWKVGGNEHEARIGGDGSILELKENLALEQVPAEVQSALREIWPDAADLECKSKTTFADGSSATVYEIRGSIDGRKTPPVRIRPDGTVERAPHPKPAKPAGG